MAGWSIGATRAKLLRGQVTVPARTPEGEVNTVPIRWDRSCRRARGGRRERMSNARQAPRTTAGTAGPGASPPTTGATWFGADPAHRGSHDLCARKPRHTARRPLSTATLRPGTEPHRPPRVAPLPSPSAGRRPDEALAADLRPSGQGVACIAGSARTAHPASQRPMPSSGRAPRGPRRTAAQPSVTRSTPLPTAR